MPGRQAKIITPAMLRRMLGAVAGRKQQTRPRHHLAVGQGRPARLRDRAARLVDGARRARTRRRLPGRLRRHRQEARRSAHPDASQPRAGAGRPQARLGAGGASGSLRSWRRHAADQHRHGSPPCSPAWSSRSVHGVRASQLQYGGGAKRAQDRLQPARRATAGRSQVDTGDAGLYRRRHARAAAVGSVALPLALPLATPRPRRAGENMAGTPGNVINVDCGQTSLDQTPPRRGAGFGGYRLRRRHRRQQAM